MCKVRSDMYICFIEPYLIFHLSNVWPDVFLLIYDVMKEHQKRIEIIKHEKLCFSCFGYDKISVCTSKYRCHKCNRKHHMSICNNQPDGEGEKKNSESANNNYPSSTSRQCLLTEDSECNCDKQGHTGWSMHPFRWRIAKVIPLTMTCYVTIFLFDHTWKRPFTFHYLNSTTHLPKPWKLHRFKSRQGMDSSSLYLHSSQQPLQHHQGTQQALLRITKLTHLKGLFLAHPVTSVFQRSHLHHSSVV